MEIIKFTHHSDGEEIKCKYIVLGKLRIVIALASSRWRSREKKNKFPINLNKHGLFIGKLGIKAERVN